MKNNRMKKIDILGWILVTVLVMFNCIIIYKGTWAFFHSDGSTVIAFAREQWAQKKLYPDGWYYGTAIWNFGLNTIIIPFFALCKNWLDARAMAVIVQMLVMLGIILVYAKAGIIKKYTWVTILVMLLPVSEVVSEHLYFQATYMTALIYLAVLILAVVLILTKHRWMIAVGATVMIGILYFNIATGYTMILVFVCPMFLTLLIQCIQKMKKNISKRHLLSHIRVMLLLFVGTVSGMVYNADLMSRLHVNKDVTGGYNFIKYDQIGDSLLRLVQCFLRLYGAADQHATLLSLNGVNKAMAFVYMIFMLFVVPVGLLKNYHKLKNDNQKMFVMFSIISSLALMYIFVFTGMTQARYLIWIYFYTVINLGIWLDNYKNMNYCYSDELKVGLVIFGIIFISGIYIYYMRYDYNENVDSLGANNNNIDYKIDYDLLDYLEKEGYTYGFANYWTSHVYTSASNGEVQIAAVNDTYTQPYLWLTSDKLYKKKAHKGKCFVLILDWQLERLPIEYTEMAIDKIEYNNHTIFIYEDAKVVRKIWKKYKGAQ